MAPPCIYLCYDEMTVMMTMSVNTIKEDKLYGRVMTMSSGSDSSDYPPYIKIMYGLYE